MRIAKLQIALALGLAGCVGMVGAEDPSAQGAIVRKPIGNGPALNGHSLSVSYAGSSLEALWLEGSQLVGWANGEAQYGDALVDTTLSAHNAPGGGEGDALLRIDGVVGPLDEDVFEYTVTREDGRPLCDDGGPAVALAGEWDYSAGWGGGGHRDDGSSFTFACVGRSLGKCVEGGYKPWAGLGDYHQACTRMMRADYCGNGLSATEDGHPIHMWDDLGILAMPESEAGWSLESIWGPDGASCVSHARMDALVSQSYLAYSISPGDGETGLGPYGASAGGHAVHRPGSATCLSGNTLRLLFTCDQATVFGPILVETQPPPLTSSCHGDFCTL